MARLTALFLAFALGLAGAVGLASCGGGSGADLLPGTTADQIESNLNQVEELAAEEDCVGAENAVAGLPRGRRTGRRGPEAEAALQEGTAKLSEVVRRCEEETTSEETEPALETDVEPEVEEEKKPKKEKPEKEEKNRPKKKNRPKTKAPNCRRSRTAKAKKKAAVANHRPNPKKKPRPAAV